jgi:Glycosyl hydrolase-like 10
MRSAGRRRLAGAALGALAAPSAGRAAAGRPFDTEIVVRTARNVRASGDAARLIDLAARHSVGTVNLAAKQDESDEVPSGVVFYQSRIAPIAPGYEAFDALGEAVGAAHRRGLRLRAWVPQFHDAAAADAHPAWRMQALVDGRVAPFAGDGGREIFLDPLNPEVQAYQRALLVEIVRTHEVDGIVLDWLRFDDFAMDLGAATRARYAAAFGYEPVDIDFARDNPRRAQWNSWRAAGIGAYVASVRAALDAVRLGVELGAYILPPEFVETGQDAAAFARHVGLLSPMAYFREWGYSPDWVVRNVVPQTVQKAAGTAVVPVLDHDWDDAAYREIVPGLRRVAPAITTLSWFAYGAWTEAELARIAGLRKL